MKIHVKKIFILSFLIITVLFTNLNIVYATDNATDAPEITSGAAILIDNETNRILYDKMQMKECFQQVPQKL